MKRWGIRIVANSVPVPPYTPPMTGWWRRGWRLKTGAGKSGVRTAWRAVPGGCAPSRLGLRDKARYLAAQDPRPREASPVIERSCNKTTRTTALADWRGAIPMAIDKTGLGFGKADAQDSYDCENSNCAQCRLNRHGTFPLAFFFIIHVTYVLQKVTLCRK
jgi:hypothetical protein